MGRERGGVSFADIARRSRGRSDLRRGPRRAAFIAQRLTSYEFFLQGQERGLTLPVVNAPEEVMEDEHYNARRFPVTVEHPELGRPVTYTGAPFIMEASPWRLPASRTSPRGTPTRRSSKLGGTR